MCGLRYGHGLSIGTLRTLFDFTIVVVGVDERCVLVAVHYHMLVARPFM